ncbi:hypothetical protein Q5P01_009344 [Channa striata]|uniref:Uncharacterized protein n=1 Tax=Channa striata TaxID=64152 RepID=A0AA88N3V6_CHASR|nr:hypothetical protein Q5P01_009344 [Channa striata]
MRTPAELTLDLTEEHQDRNETRDWIMQDAVNHLLAETESVADKVARLLSFRKTENQHLSADVDFLQEEVDFLQKKNYEDCENLKKDIVSLQHRVDEAQQLIVEREEIITVQQRDIAFKQDEIEEQSVLIHDLRQTVRELKDQLEMKQTVEIRASFDEECRALAGNGERLDPVADRDQEGDPEPQPRGFWGWVLNGLCKLRLGLGSSAVSAADQAKTVLRGLRSGAHELLDACCCASNNRQPTQPGDAEDRRLRVFLVPA